MPPKRLIPSAVTKAINTPVVNGVMRPLARFVPPLGIVVHVGRKSGKEFRTPVTMFVSNGRVVIPLAHGEQVNWVLNVVSAGSAEVERLGKTHRIIRPRIITRVGHQEPLPAAIKAATAGVRWFVADIA